MRIAIVDDIPAERAQLSRLLSTVLRNREDSAFVLEFPDGASFLACAQRERFDLAFLDIYMDGINGIETARKLREFDPECTVVFSTTSPDHALDGYGVWAMQYLVKPYGIQQVESVLGELERRKPMLEKSIRVPVGRHEVPIPLADIQWAESYQHQIHIHRAQGGTVAVRMTFAKFTALLGGDERFVVCHRGGLVNLMYVADFDGKLFHMKDGSRIPVSRSQGNAARLAFGKYLFERRR